MAWFRRPHKTERDEARIRVAGANGFGKPFHLVFSWHPLPDAGAMQVSYDTLCLPKYSPIGNGPGNAREFETVRPSLQPLKGANLVAIGSPGIITGQMVAQPLTDITSPDPNAVANAYAGVTLRPGQYALPL